MPFQKGCLLYKPTTKPRVPIRFFFVCHQLGGMAVWPAGQVLAQAAAGYALEAKKEKKSITALELGGSRLTPSRMVVATQIFW